MDPSFKTFAVLIKASFGFGLAYGEVPFSYEGEAGVLPVSELKPEQVCEGVSYYDRFGKLTKGAMNCKGAVGPLCQQDGATNCQTHADFPAADTTNAASKILAGESLAGVLGTFRLPSQAEVASGVSFGAKGALLGSAELEQRSDCTGALQTDCLTVPSFPSMDLSNQGAGGAQDLKATGLFTALRTNASFEYWDETGTRHTLMGDSDLNASHILENIEVFGITGQMQPRPADCSQSAEMGCLATTSWPAVEVSALAGKVLLNQTVAGVDGTVTLPDPGETYQGITYGVSGTSLTGTLILVAGGDVLNGSGDFGRPGAMISPSLTLPDGGNVLFSVGTFGNPDSPVSATFNPDFPEPENVLTIDTVDGATGTLTLPPESQVFQFVTYGVGGNGSSGTLTLPAPGYVREAVGAYGRPSSALTALLEDCGTNNQTGCVTTSAFPAMDRSNTSGTPLDSNNFASQITTGNSYTYWDSTGHIHTIMGNGNIQPGNIRNGVEIFGVGGDYPSSDYPLAEDTSTPDLTDLPGQLTSDDSFEFFDAAGYRYTAQGDSDLIAEHVKRGVELEMISMTGTSGALSCPSGFVVVEGDSDFGTRDFCVMKHEAKMVSGDITATYANTPKVSISYYDAKKECSSMGAGYDLMDNDEWMTVAAQAALISSNWSGGAVGSGNLYRGHSDGDPSYACAANSDDYLAFVEGNCTGANQAAEDDPDTQRRTLSLVNDEVIWDIAGNVLEWVDLINKTDKPYHTAGTGWQDYRNVDQGFALTKKSDLIMMSEVKPSWDNSWNVSTKGVGSYKVSDQNTGGHLFRGGQYSQQINAGAFMASFSPPGTGSWSDVGFRCTRGP